MTTKALMQIVIDSLEQTNLRQLGLLRLADIVWLHCINRMRQLMHNTVLTSSKR